MLKYKVLLSPDAKRS